MFRVQDEARPNVIVLLGRRLAVGVAVGGLLIGAGAGAGALTAAPASTGTSGTTSVSLAAHDGGGYNGPAKKKYAKPKKYKKYELTPGSIRG